MLCRCCCCCYCCCWCCFHVFCCCRLTHGPTFVRNDSWPTVCIVCMCLLCLLCLLSCLLFACCLFAVAIAARAVLLVLYRGDGALWSSSTSTCSPPERVAYLSCTGGVLLLSCVCVCVCLCVYVGVCLCVTSVPSYMGGCCLDGVVPH